MLHNDQGDSARKAVRVSARDTAARGDPAQDDPASGIDHSRITRDPEHRAALQ